MAAAIRAGWWIHGEKSMVTGVRPGQVRMVLCGHDKDADVAPSTMSGVAPRN